MSDSTAPKDGNRNRAVELMTVAWCECAVSMVFVALRMYSRIKITHNLWWDDYFILLTSILVIIFSSFWTVLGANDGCRHLYYLSPEQISLVTKINWMSQPFVIMALATGKISVAFLILRIMGQSTWRRGFLYFSMITCFIFCALASIFSFVQCSPPRALWTPSIKAKCWKPESQSDFSVFVGSWLALMDIALALLPITIINKLQLNTRKKLGLCTLMGLGIFAGICGAIKTSKLPLLSARSDFTWETVTLFVWNANEINTVIIAACIPTLRPLFLIIFKRPEGDKYLTKPEYRSQGSSGERPTKLGTTSVGISGGVVLPSTGRKHNWLEMDSRQDLHHQDGNIRQTIEMDVTYTPRDQSQEEQFLAQETAPRIMYARNAV